MKRVLFYTTFLTQGGGIEVAAIRYVNEFVKRGYIVDLYIDYDFGKENIREKEVNKKIKIKYLRSEKLSKFIYKLRTLGKSNKFYNIFLYLFVILSDYFIWKRIIKDSKDKQYDLVITFFQFQSSYITKIRARSHLIFLHGSVTRFFTGLRKYFKRLFFKKLNKFDYICTVSQEMGKELLRIAPELKSKQRTVYNPIDFNIIEEKGNEIEELSEKEKNIIKEKYLCSVGRLDEVDKDFTNLIIGYKELLEEENIKENLVIIGDGPNKRELENLVLRLKMEKRVIFLGRKQNPYIWIKNSEAFILSSKSEGFGIVLIEALVLNKKVVSSDCPVGPREILNNGKYGELFEVGNTKEMKKKIMKVLNPNYILLENKSYLKNKFTDGIVKIEEIINDKNK